MNIQCILFYGNTDNPLTQLPAGVFRLATELRNNRYSVLCLETSFLENEENLDFFINNIFSHECLWVGISTTFLRNFLDKKFYRNLDNRNDSPKFDKFIKSLKNKNKNIKFLVGGSTSVDWSEYEFIHHKGYADDRIVEITNEIVNLRTNIKNTYTIDPNTSSFDFQKSKIIWTDYDPVKILPVLPIEISRGCRFKCKFCAFPMNGRKKNDYLKFSDILLEELEYNYNKFGITDYTFSDDTYNESVEKIEFYYNNVFSKLSFKINFTAYIRNDLMCRYDSMAEILSKSGLINAIIGLESINQKNLQVIGKNALIDKQLTYVKHIKSNIWKNIMISSGFIVGLPYDTKNEIQKLDDFLLNQDVIDGFNLASLSINPYEESSHRMWYSDFDLNYLKYGYIIDKIVPHKIGAIKWKNINTDADYDYCEDIVKKIMLRAKTSQDNYKCAGRVFSEYSIYGSELKEKMFSLPYWKIHELFKINDLKQSKKIEYEKFIKNQFK